LNLLYCIIVLYDILVTI